MRTPDEMVRSVCFIVRRYREQKKFSQESFADAAGVNRTYYGKIERAQQRGVSLFNLQRIANGLNVPLSQLLIEAESYDLSVREPPNPPRIGRPRGRVLR